MNLAADTLMRRFGQALFWRLPILALVGGIFALLWGVAIRLGRQVDNAAG